MRKEILFPVIIGVLILMIAIISFLLLFFRKNPGLIYHKIKLGLIVLSLQALIAGCGSSIQTGEEISCYAKPIEPDLMSLVNSHYKNGKYLYKRAVDSIRVNVSERKSTFFSYAIMNHDGQVVVNGDLKACDLVLDKAWEELFVPLPQNLKAGDYQLVFYNSKFKDTIANVSRRASYPILIM